MKVRRLVAYVQGNVITPRFVLARLPLDQLIEHPDEKRVEYIRRGLQEARKIKDRSN